MNSGAVLEGMVHAAVGRNDWQGNLGSMFWGCSPWQCMESFPVLKSACR